MRCGIGRSELEDVGRLSCSSAMVDAWVCGFGRMLRGLNLSTSVDRCAFL